MVALSILAEEGASAEEGRRKARGAHGTAAAARGGNAMVCVAAVVRPLPDAGSGGGVLSVTGLDAATAEDETQALWLEGYDRPYHLDTYSVPLRRGRTVPSVADVTPRDEADQLASLFSAVGRSHTDAAFQGVNSCLLAYGHTGSGKTHTMFGARRGAGFVKGMAQRAVEDLFERAGRYEGVSVAVSVYEVYQERVYCLLSEGKAAAPLKIRVVSASSPVVVEGLASVPVRTAEEAIRVIAQGEAARRAADTKANLKSSRSHAVVQISLSGVGSGAASAAAKVTLVDLAGSERFDKRAATNPAAAARQQQLQAEGIHINKSLQALGRVVHALGAAEALHASSSSASAVGSNGHVSFRDSVLTLVLQDCLGSSKLGCKLTLLACLSPAASMAEESLSTIRFADNVKAIKPLSAAAVAAGGLNPFARKVTTPQQAPTERVVDPGAVPRWHPARQQQQADARAPGGSAHVVGSLPLLVNLDPHLSPTDALSFELSAGMTTVGTAQGFAADPPSPSDPATRHVLLNGGVNVSHPHCYITVERKADGGHSVRVSPAAGALTYLDGQLVTSASSLEHASRLIFGGSHCFLLIDPSEAERLTRAKRSRKLPKVLDWGYATDEYARVMQVTKSYEEVIQIQDELEYWRSLAEIPPPSTDACATVTSCCLMLLSSPDYYTSPKLAGRKPGLVFPLREGVNKVCAETWGLRSLCDGGAFYLKVVRGQVYKCKGPRRRTRVRESGSDAPSEDALGSEDEDDDDDEDDEDAARRQPVYHGIKIVYRGSEFLVNCPCNPVEEEEGDDPGGLGAVAVSSVVVGGAGGGGGGAVGDSSSASSDDLGLHGDDDDDDDSSEAHPSQHSSVPPPARPSARSAHHSPLPPSKKQRGTGGTPPLPPPPSSRGSATGGGGGGGAPTSVPPTSAPTAFPSMSFVSENLEDLVQSLWSLQYQVLVLHDHLYPLPLRYYGDDGGESGDDHHTTHHPHHPHRGVSRSPGSSSGRSASGAAAAASSSAPPAMGELARLAAQDPRVQEILDFKLALKDDAILECVEVRDGHGPVRNDPDAVLLFLRELITRVRELGHHFCTRLDNPPPQPFESAVQGEELLRELHALREAASAAPPAAAAAASGGGGVTAEALASVRAEAAAREDELRRRCDELSGLLEAEQARAAADRKEAAAAKELLARLQEEEQAWRAAEAERYRGEAVWRGQLDEVVQVLDKKCEELRAATLRAEARAAECEELRGRLAARDDAAAAAEARAEGLARRATRAESEAADAQELLQTAAVEAAASAERAAAAEAAVQTAAALDAEAAALLVPPAPEGGGDPRSVACRVVGHAAEDVVKTLLLDVFAEAAGEAAAAAARGGGGSGGVSASVLSGFLRGLQAASPLEDAAAGGGGGGGSPVEMEAGVVEAPPLATPPSVPSPVPPGHLGGAGGGDTPPRQRVPETPQKEEYKTLLRKLTEENSALARALERARADKPRGRKAASASPRGRAVPRTPGDGHDGGVAGVSDGTVPYDVRLLSSPLPGGSSSRALSRTPTGPSHRSPSANGDAADALLAGGSRVRRQSRLRPPGGEKAGGSRRSGSSTRSPSGTRSPSRTRTRSNSSRGSRASHTGVGGTSARSHDLSASLGRTLTERSHRKPSEVSGTAAAPALQMAPRHVAGPVPAARKSPMKSPRGAGGGGGGGGSGTAVYRTTSTSSRRSAVSARDPPSPRAVLAAKLLQQARR